MIEFSVRCDSKTVWRNSVFETCNDLCAHPIVNGNRGAPRPAGNNSRYIFYVCASTSCSFELICVCVDCRCSVTIRLLRALISILFPRTFGMRHEGALRMCTVFMIEIMLWWQFSLWPNNFYLVLSRRLQPRRRQTYDDKVVRIHSTKKSLRWPSTTSFPMIVIVFIDSILSNSIHSLRCTTLRLRVQATGLFQSQTTDHNDVEEREEQSYVGRSDNTVNRPLLQKHKNATNKRGKKSFFVHSIQSVLGYVLRSLNFFFFLFLF